MKTRIRIFPILCGIVGLLFAAGTVKLVFDSLNEPPYILQEPESAAKCADDLMSSICDGDFDSASSFLLGMPDLELNRAPADAVGVLLWDAYVQSSTYELKGSLYATETGLAQDVTFRAMDVDAVMEAIGPLAKEIFQSRMDAVEDTSSIYDEDGNYREEFVQDALMDAARQALEENYCVTDTDITLQLSYQNGQWLVTADQTLLRLIGGGITG